MLFNLHNCDCKICILGKEIAYFEYRFFGYCHWATFGQCLIGHWASFVKQTWHWLQMPQRPISLCHVVNDVIASGLHAFRKFRSAPRVYVSRWCSLMNIN